MKIKRTTGDIGAERLVENLAAQVDTDNANITYLACMCDVDLPTEGEVNDEHAGI